jgi:hypothetical protein
MTTLNAITASDFTNSIGINTHIDFNAFGYENLSTVISAINYLGVKNLRDSSSSGSGAWMQVAQATGARFDDYIAETSVGGMQSELGVIQQMAQAGILNYVEGGNEEDTAYPASLGNDLWTTAQFQQQVFALGRQFGLPVINMSFGAGWTAANDWHGNYDKVGDLSAYADYANAHTYPNPGQTADSTIRQINGDALLAAGNRPVITSEMGWNASTTSQDAIARYIVQAALDGVKNGNSKTYFYALFNDQSGNFGVMNSDGSPTPAANSLHNLTSLLADSGGANFAPNALSFTLDGAQGGDNTLLMQKSDGSDWLALWNESDGPHTVTLNLGAAASQILVFDPVTGTSAIAGADNSSSITLNVGNDPLLVEVVAPGNAPSTISDAGNPSGAVASPDPTPTPTLPPPTAPTGPDVTPAPAADTSQGGQQIAADDSQPVITASNTAVSATAGDHMIFIAGTGDSLTATGGTQYVQAYQGGNSITTGAGDDTVRVAGSGNTTNAGAGFNHIEDSGSNNTLVLPGANQGYDDVFGWVAQNGDQFDLRSLLAATSWNGDGATIGDFVKVNMSGNDAVIAVDPSGGAGAGSADVAMFHSSGAMDLSTLLAHAIT